MRLPPPCSLSPSGLDADNSGILGDSGALRQKGSQPLDDCMKELLLIDLNTTECFVEPLHVWVYLLLHVNLP